MIVLATDEKCSTQTKKEREKIYGNRHTRKHNLENRLCADSGDNKQGSGLRADSSEHKRYDSVELSDNRSNRSSSEEQSNRSSNYSDGLRVHGDSDRDSQQRDSSGNGAGYKLDTGVLVIMTAHTSPTITERRTITKVAEVRQKILIKKVTMSTDQTTTFSDVTAITSAHVCLVASPGTEYTCTVATNVVTLTESAITDAEVLVIGVEN